MTSIQHQKTEPLLSELAAIASQLGDADRTRVAAARDIADRAHRDQTRRHGAPYLVHPLRVMLILWNDFAERSVNVLCAALLHDVLEDAPLDVTANEIESACGADVLELVVTLTAPSGLEKAEQNRQKIEKVRAGSTSAKLIKLADRIDNLRDALVAPGGEGRRFRQRYYTDTLTNYRPLAQEVGNAQVLQRFECALRDLDEAVIADVSTPRCVSAGRIELDVGGMHLPENLEECYRSLLDSAFDKMHRLEAGQRVNREEGTQVGHFWLRNAEAAPAPYGEWIKRTLADIDSFCHERFIGNFDRLLWIGIGGSALGPQMLYDALRIPGQTPEMFFFDNTDPDGMWRVLQELGGGHRLRRTLTVIVSKSGGTKETQNGMLVAQHAYATAGIPYEECFVAITKPGSKLDKLAGPANPEDPETNGPEWLRRFPIWDWVGGRTSLFSPVGMLPTKLLNLDPDQLREGARVVDATGEECSVRDNPALLLAATWFHAVENLGLRNMVVLPYCDRLRFLSKYLQQLIMESLGKDGKGITVYGNKGSTDQHSYVQQLREGYADFFVTFINVLQPDTDWMVVPSVSDVVSPSAPSTQITVGDYLAAFYEGTAQALTDAGRLSMRVTVDALDSTTLGGLVALFERAVGYYAGMIGINAYHQPGVEAGKLAAAALLALQVRLVDELRSDPAAQRPVAELATRVEASPDHVYAILKRLAACNRLGIIHHTSDQQCAPDRHLFGLRN